MNIYLFIVVPIMAIMCGVCLWIFVGDARYLWRSMKGEGKHETIKNAARNYGQAAIIVGGACLFLGDPNVCEELCDDLWHYGQQARMERLTGEETQFDVM